MELFDAAPRYFGVAGAGKTLRLGRFLVPGRRAGIIVPIDHGLTVGPIEGIQGTRRIARWIRSPYVRGVIAHKGMAERLASRGLLDGRALMVHLNGMSSLAPCPDTKELLTTVEAAVRLGGDAVSVQVNFDGDNDAHNLTLLGAVADEAQRYGMPLLAMVYDKAEPPDDDLRIARLRHLMRIAIELGCDAVKIAPPRLSEISVLLEDLSTDALVFFAGGERTSDADLVEVLRAAIAHGGAGLCVGRNVFQRPPGDTLLERFHRTIVDGADPSLATPRTADHASLGAT